MNEKAASMPKGFQRRPLEPPTQAPNKGLKGSGGLNFVSRNSFEKVNEGAETVEVTYEFSNSQDQPIRVVEVKTTCGCLQAKADKAVYQPGETGKIEAMFSLEGQRGKVVRGIIVRTDWQEDPEAILSAAIEIPATMIIEPKIVRWSPNDAHQPKIITVRAIGTEPLQITKIQSSREGVDVKLETVVKDNYYEIKITPQSWDAPVVGSVKIETESGKSELAYYRIETE